MKYVYHPKLGNFEVPKNKSTTDIQDLHKKYEQKLEFEKKKNELVSNFCLDLRKVGSKNFE